MHPRPRLFLCSLVWRLHSPCRPSPQALRAERNALAEELAALTPEFFDEVEDLKYNYAQAQAELERLEVARGAAAASGVDEQGRGSCA